MKTNSEMQQDLRDLIRCSTVTRQAQKNYFADRSPNNLQDAKRMERDFDILVGSLDKKYNGIQQTLDLAPAPDEMPIIPEGHYSFGDASKKKEGQYLPPGQWIEFPPGQNIIKARFNPGDPQRIEVVFKSGSTYHYFKTGELAIYQDWIRWMEYPPAARMDYFIRNVRSKLRYIKAEGE